MKENLHELQNSSSVRYCQQLITTWFLACNFKHFIRLFWQMKDWNSEKANEEKIIIWFIQNSEVFSKWSSIDNDIERFWSQSFCCLLSRKISWEWQWKFWRELKYNCKCCHHVKFQRQEDLHLWTKTLFSNLLLFYWVSTIQELKVWLQHSKTNRWETQKKQISENNYTEASKTDNC